MPTSTGKSSLVTANVEQIEVGAPYVNSGCTVTTGLRVAGIDLVANHCGTNSVKCLQLNIVEQVPSAMVASSGRDGKLALNDRCQLGLCSFA